MTSSRPWPRRVIVFENQQLKYFRGGFAEFEQRSEEWLETRSQWLGHGWPVTKAAMLPVSLSGSGNGRLRTRSIPTTTRCAKRSSGSRKSARVGLGRDDGKRYKTNSLKALNESTVRLPSRVEAERARREDQFLKLPSVAAARRRDGVGVAEQASSGPCGGADVLKDMSAQLRAGARVAVGSDRTARGNPRS